MDTTVVFGTAAGGRPPKEEFPSIVRYSESSGCTTLTVVFRCGVSCLSMDKCVPFWLTRVCTTISSRFDSKSFTSPRISSETSGDAEICDSTAIIAEVKLAETSWPFSRRCDTMSNAVKSTVTFVEFKLLRRISSEIAACSESPGATPPRVALCKWSRRSFDGFAIDWFRKIRKAPLGGSGAT